MRVIKRISSCAAWHRARSRIGDKAFPCAVITLGWPWQHHIILADCTPQLVNRQRLANPKVTTKHKIRQPFKALIVFPFSYGPAHRMLRTGKSVDKFGSSFVRLDAEVQGALRRAVSVFGAFLREAARAAAGAAVEPHGVCAVSCIATVSPNDRLGVANH